MRLLVPSRSMGDAGRVVDQEGAAGPMSLAALRQTVPRPVGVSSLRDRRTRG